MNNGENEIVRLLKDVESELTALKTAHKRPLGALNFFKKSSSFSVPLEESFGIYIANITLTITVEVPTSKPPIVQTGWDVPSGFMTVWFYGVTTSSDYSTWTYELTLLSMNPVTAGMNVGVVSSQPIQNIAWSVS